ncbi:hypothetical protein DYB30_011732 [Aphanomyces astaci]|uniref:Uncharacterized protein n=1 Tax=Aphanomyces astaci TaxID=112090 RepID=A0A397DS43_APHAT|nr:hypothetical protein DYB30_011732 [Aphanomyces astaci]
MDVACGPRHILLRSSSGRVFSFGSGDSGRLGHGDVLSRLDPTLIQALRSQVVVGVACGRDHSAVVCASGLAYTFGWGEGGRLGIGHDAGDVLWPTQVVLPNAVRGFHLVAAGREATVLVSRCGRVFVCGLAHVGPTAHALHLAPHHLDGCDDENAGAGGIVSVKAGDAHCVVRMSDGSLYSWGDGASGALGHGDLLTKVHPTKVPGLPSVQKVVCGAWHTACLTTQGHVWVWGDTMGSSTSSPTRIGNKSASIDEDKPVCYRDVACGGDGAMFVQRHDHTVRHVSPCLRATSHSKCLIHVQVWSWQGDNSGQQRTATRVWPPAVTNDNEHAATTYQASAATLKCTCRI